MRVYRIVGPDEAADIAAAGVYRNPAGLEGRYFFPTQVQAENLAAMYGKAGIGGPYTLTSGVVPRGVYGSAEQLAAAGEGPEVFLRTPQLPSVTDVTIHGVLP